MGASLSDTSHGSSSSALSRSDRHLNATTSTETATATSDDYFVNSNVGRDPHRSKPPKTKWWRRRASSSSSRSADPGRPLREILNNGGWSIGEVFALVHDYDTTSKEKELYLHSESARPRSQPIRSDLADLLDFKWNSDVNLILPPAIFPAHRAILMQRSKYFKSLLQHHQQNVNIEDPVDIPTFSSYIRFLYTEESSTELENFNPELFSGMMRPTRGLEGDLRELLQSGKYADVVISVGDDQIPCHKSVLVARAGFFRSLFQRRTQSTPSSSSSSPKPLLVLDESVIPKRYTRVILHCMYTDRIDLTLIDPASGLTEVEVLTFTGRLNPAGFEEAMELYQIGKFLEFDHLSQLSEDIIIEQLTLDSLPAVLKWSSQSYGSNWVRRQAMLFLREEYLNFSTTNGFLELDKQTLLECIQSDFLQASEVDILQSILRWGEHQLVRRIEDREPNLVSTTRDSVTRKGIKRRDLSDVELREIIIDLLRLVRTDHILLNHEVLVGAVRRGLVSIPPSHMITEDKRNPWINSSSGGYVRPRLYTPFYEEAKAALRQRASVSNSTASILDGHNVSTTMGRRTLRSIIPDTLYMIEDGSSNNAAEQPQMESGVMKPGDVVVDPEVLSSMLYRLKKLQSNKSLNLVSTNSRAGRYLRLRVVREFGFPDYVADMLDPSLHNNPSNSQQPPDDPMSTAAGSSTVAGASSTIGGAVGGICEDTSITPLPESLHGKIPDIALTASSDQFRLSEEMMDLDLGDGSSSHHHQIHQRRHPSSAYHSHTHHQQLHHQRSSRQSEFLPSQEQQQQPTTSSRQQPQQQLSSSLREAYNNSHYL